MEIKTKYNLHDTVYLMHNNEIIEGKIEGIDYTTRMAENLRIKYLISYKPPSKFASASIEDVREYSIFPSKEELLKSL